MNSVHMSARLTKDPEIRGESCILKLAYEKVSGRKSYITAVANGKIKNKLMKYVKGDTLWIDGHLSGFVIDKWKTYIEIDNVCCAQPKEEGE